MIKCKCKTKAGHSQDPGSGPGSRVMSAATVNYAGSIYVEAARTRPETYLCHEFPSMHQHDLADHGGPLHRNCRDDIFW